ncbi:MAG: amidase, partial [Ignavibacteria bacterium RIFOXYA2_FULL_37_17]
GDFLISASSKKLSGQFIASLEDEKIKIFQNEKEVLSSNEIVFSPDDIETESFLLRDVVIGKNFHWERKENQRFRGTLKFIKEKNLISAVNIIPIEEYLVSVISSEMSANSSLELLKAHAIVSRSWLLAQLEKQQKNKNEKNVSEIKTETEIIRWYDREDHLNYDLCADDHCQRYQGVSKIINDNALNAIEATRGLVLQYDNQICDTRYSKCCGGMTESFESVWENIRHHYLSPVIDYKFELDGVDYDLTNNKIAEQWIKSNPNAYCNTTDQRILSQILVDFDRPTDNFFRWK